MCQENFNRLVADLQSSIDKMSVSEKRDAVGRVKTMLRNVSPFNKQPVDDVQWVPVEQVEPNSYNPNAVAAKEMQLLGMSIQHDGYTQPVVTMHDVASGKYVIVDGFHRYHCLKTSSDLRRQTDGHLPVVVIDKPINELMASTVRHNRARGKHTVRGMSSLVFSMLDNGWSDAEVCNELGMEPTELLRLKHITGFSKLFADAEYRKAWVTRNQIRYATEHKSPCL